MIARQKRPSRTRSYSKYGNRSTAIELEGERINCSSRLEARVGEILNLRALAGEIKDLRAQHTIYMTKARIQYIVDFSHVNIATGETEYTEAKGMVTPEWRLKRRLWIHYGPGRLDVFMTNRGGIYLSETIIPKLGGSNDE